MAHAERLCRQWQAGGLSKKHLLIWPFCPADRFADVLRAANNKTAGSAGVPAASLDLVKAALLFSGGKATLVAICVQVGGRRKALLRGEPLQVSATGTHLTGGLGGNAPRKLLG
jgi:hypothetical protein